MLVVSTAVTALTQFFLHVRETKGKKLKVGIADLLELIGSNIDRQCAERIADTVLRHPLVSPGDNKLSDTIHREELVKMLLELSTATAPTHSPTPTAKLSNPPLRQMASKTQPRFSTTLARFSSNSK